MKISIKKILVIVLMSAFTSVACQAQTSKINGAVKLTAEDVAKIGRSLARNRNHIWEDDILMATDLLQQANTPIEGVVQEKGEFIEKSFPGDDWSSFISYQNGTFWLSYLVMRKEKFIGRLDIRLD